MSKDDKTICVVAHFEPADQLLASEFGDYVVAPDWAIGRMANRGGIDKDKFTEFVCLAAGFRGDFARIRATHEYYPDSFTDPKLGGDPKSPPTLREYAVALLSNGLGKLMCSRPDRVVIAINLLCFEPKERHYDQIVSALKEVLDEHGELNRPSTAVVLLAHGSRDVLATQSGSLPPMVQEFVEGERWRPRIRLFDYERRACYELDWAGPEPTLMRMPIGDEILFGCLDVRDKDLADEFVFRTNVQIGHFRVGKSHIRTHYDMREFVKKDFACERVLHELRSMFIDMGGDVRCERCVMVIGIHEMALYDLASALRASGLVGSVVVGSERTFQKAKRIITRCERLVILADVVHTGATVEKALKDVREIWEKADVKLAKVRLLSVAKMSNSPSLILDTPLSSLVVVERPFYSPSDCPLCLMAASGTKKKLKEMKKPENFKHAGNQLTPFDFWEMVGDRKALMLSPSAANAGTWCWVSTVDSADGRKGIVDRYYVWLRGLVKERLNSRCISPGDIKSIVTVAEDSGRQFAWLVADALDLSRRSVVEIPRDEVLRRRMAVINFGSASILIVDDGINSGGTFEMLAGCVPGEQVRACVVLDNRLDGTATGYLCERCGFGTGEVISLYGWCSGGVEATSQLESMLTRWDGIRFRYDPIGAIIDYCGRVRKGLDAIFDMNGRLYEVFCDDDMLTNEERVLLVRNLSRDEDLVHYCKDSVVKKYGKLFAVAKEVIATGEGHEPSAQRAGAHVGVAKGPNRDESINGIPSRRKTSDGGAVDEYVIARTVSICAGGAEKKHLGTGFLITSEFLRSHGFSAPILVTCGHVAERIADAQTFVAHEGLWHEVHRWGERNERLAIDLEFCTIEGARDGWDAFEITGDVSLDCNMRYWGCTYEANKIDAPNVRPLECHSTIQSHTGTVEFRDYQIVREAKDEKALDIDGASGSPVVDAEKRLVGFIRSSDMRAAEYLSVGVVLGSHIQREVENRVSISERMTKDEHVHEELQF